MRPQLSLILLLIGFLLSNPTHARKVRRDEVRPFAANFSCSNPYLKWQFENIESLYDENERLRSQAGSKHNIVDTASDIGGDGDWMYRGVTNRQFNEQQILGLIFNDPATVSESRWVSKGMFEKAGIAVGADFVGDRARFLSLPSDQKCGALKTAIGDTSNTIDRLINEVSGVMNGFSEHVRIGSGYNATPEAIQFLTPHKNYAEGYGEFVLHIREVVRRGIDVERYNYHNPNWSYRIGSIYSMDRDEYMVPSHIPGWDVQVIKVREGTGWHRRSYGATTYYYTKMFEDKNPCEVTGVRVDKPGRSGQDNDRVPVGVLLVCPKGQTCSSTWTDQLDRSHLERLKNVVAQTRVNDQPLYFVPYEVYTLKDPKQAAKLNLPAIANYYDKIPAKIKNDAGFWQTVIERNIEDYNNGFRLAQKSSVLKSSAFKTRWKAKVEAKIATPGYRVPDSHLGGLIDLTKHLGIPITGKVHDQIMNEMDNGTNRMQMIQLIGNRVASDARLKPTYEAMKKKMAELKDLSLQDKIAFLQMQHPGTINGTLIQIVAEGLVEDTSFASRYYSTIVGDDMFKVDLLEKALIYIDEHADEIPMDIQVLWSGLAASLKHHPERNRILGLLIDYEIAHSTATPDQLFQKLAGFELPPNREVDTLRSLWGYVKNQAEHPLPGSHPINSFEIFSLGKRNRLVHPLLNSAGSLDRENNQSRVDNLTNAYIQLQWEYVSPPVPLLGFSALHNMARMTDRYELLTTWPTGPQTFELNGNNYTVTEQDLKNALGRNLSTHYLYVLMEGYNREDDATKKAALKGTILNVLSAFEDYALNDLEGDLNNQEFVRLLSERLSFNPYEHTSGLVMALALLTDDRAKKQRLEAVAKKVQAKIPEMNLTPPSMISADGRHVEPLWKP